MIPPHDANDFSAGESGWSRWQNVTECSATCNAGGKITQLRECNDDYACSLFDPDLRLVDCNVDVPCPGNKLVIGEWTLMVRLGFVSGGRGMVGGLWTVVGL